MVNKILLAIIIVIVVILLASVGYGMYKGNGILNSILGVPGTIWAAILWIIRIPKRILTWLGFYSADDQQVSSGASGSSEYSAGVSGSSVGDDSLSAGGPPGERIIIKEKECPACPACKCPECPDCQCPECPKCDCPVRDADLEASKTEVNYLKWMSRFLGSLVRRENAMNRALMEQCPGLYGVVPFVQQVDSEVDFVKNHIKKDRGAWEYFQKHFTRYSGIPVEHYNDIIM